jgi:hypothetical protein
MRGGGWRVRSRSRSLLNRKNDTLTSELEIQISRKRELAQKLREHGNLTGAMDVSGQVAAMERELRAEQKVSGGPE